MLVAITLDDVPIDVLAERLGSTRGAVYKTLHDARRKLRAELTARGARPMTDDRALIARLLGPSEPELYSRACFEALDRYVEAQLAGHNADRLVPGMAAHLEGCPACGTTVTASPHG